MNSLDEERERNRSELGRLITLARRFAPPDYPKARAVRHDDSFDLRWWSESLTCAIKESFSEDHALFVKARAAADDDGLLLEVWKDVAKLPYEVVQHMIDFVHRQRGTWELVASLECHDDDEGWRAERDR